MGPDGIRWRPALSHHLGHRKLPAGAPIHEDGSAEYDPMKPLVLFAVSLEGPKAIAAWNRVLREFDQLRAAA